MLRFGPDEGPVVIVAPPLLEEANRTRAFATSVCRALAKREIASALPDLPGQGESAAAIENLSLADWRDAFSHAVKQQHGRAVHIASIRSGSLVTRDAKASSRWLFSPHAGDALVRELLRTRQIADRHSGFPVDAPGEALEIAGNVISRSMLRDLRDAVADRTTPARLVRLDADRDAADRHVAGGALWRRAEPGNDAALAALLADDIAQWIARCGG